MNKHLLKFLPILAVLMLVVSACGVAPLRGSRELVSESRTVSGYHAVSVSGGGTRSATFTFHVLRRADSILGGNLMRRTFLITGASGGMLGAAPPGSV